MKGVESDAPPLVRCLRYLKKVRGLRQFVKIKTLSSFLSRSDCHRLQKDLIVIKWK